MRAAPRHMHRWFLVAGLAACGDSPRGASLQPDAAGEAWNPSIGRTDRDGGSTDAASTEPTNDAAQGSDATVADASSQGVPESASCPCANGGVCATGDDTCTCPTGYGGARCEEDIDECAATPSPCSNSASYPCRNFPGGYTCLGQSAAWPIPRRSFTTNDYASQGLTVDRAAGTILDEVTGLMWQRTVPSPNDANQGAAAKACADLVLGQHDDWRLPSLIELSTLYTTAVVPSFPAALFDGTLYAAWTSRVVGTTGVYGTPEPYLYGVPTSTNGGIGHLCVRTERVLAKGVPADRYDTSTAGLVTDRSTHLMWQRTPDTKQMSYAEASDYCAGLVLGGHDDFRLPSYPELLSPCDEEGSTPHCGAALFGPNEPYLAWFWTDTLQSSTNAPIRVDYVYVRWYFDADGKTAYTRCVRKAD